MRVVADIIKSDSVIDMRELNALVAIKEKYAIKRADEAISASLTLEAAATTLEDAMEGLRSDLMGDFMKVVMADDFCAREEALLLVSLQCCLTDRLGCTGKIISINSAEAYDTDSQILYVESEYDKGVNDHIRKYYREITSEARLAGFDFVYVPQIVSHWRSMPEDTLASMTSILYPHVNEERGRSIAKWLGGTTTSSFCREFFMQKLNVARLTDAAPSLMIRIGDSCINGRRYANYLLVEIDGDVLGTVRKLLDAYTTYYRETSLNYVKESKSRFVFTGFHKQLLDLYMLRTGIRSTVVIDIYRNEIRFPEACAMLNGLHRREKALYTLFLLESASGGINFNKPDTAKQLERYGRRMAAIQAKYGMVYRKFGGEADKAPNLALSEVRLPMISLIKRQIGRLCDVLAHSEDYSIQRNIYGNYGVGISPAMCCACGVDKGDVRPLLETDDWARISAL